VGEYLYVGAKKEGIIMEKRKLKKNNKTPDLVDCEIINLLQKDGRISNTDISLILDFIKRRYAWGTAMDEK
jgi:hypothetical protein